MKQEIVKKFQDRFEWFPMANPLYGKVHIPMYIDCDEGWFDLIWKLCEDIDVIVNRESLTDFRVDQIKEKFGGLRFYVDGANKEVFDLINNAEVKSFKTCEICGKHGSMYVGWGWFKTLCRKCSKTDTRRTWIKITKKTTDGNIK